MSSLLRRWHVLATLLVAGCTPERDLALESAILASARSEDAIVTLSRLVPGDWDRVCIIPPYAAPDLAREQAGLDWRGFERSDIAYRDDVALLVFAVGDEVKRGVLVGRGIDFGSQIACLSRDSATLRAQPRPANAGDGFVLTPANSNR